MRPLRRPISSDVARDHFRRHAYQDGHVDWNFNVLFNDQPEIARMAKAYAPYIRHPGLYPPVPGEWLHMTVLRAGYTTEYTDAEMAAVAGILETRLKSMKTPGMTLGPWRIWKGGGPVLRVVPEDPMIDIFNAILASMKKVVGSSRTPKPPDFIPHVTLAYNRDYDRPGELRDLLMASSIEPVRFKVGALSLIKQEQTPPFYRWHIVRDIPVGATV